jgi:hypothetical protein
MAAVLLAAIIVPGIVQGLQAADEPAKVHRTDWFSQAKWGVMFHYCSNWFKMGENWDKTVQNFDVKGLAKQLHEVGAGYFMITAKHCGIPIAPNSVYEKAHPGKCPKRDLIADLADELAKYDIKLMLYYATGMGIDGGEGGKFSAKVIEEFSKRYGSKVKGWWLDNNVGNEELQKLLADACRAGNSDSIVAFSPPKNPRRNSKYEDYTAGNTHAPGAVRCGGRWVSGAQWHILTYIGNNWGGYCKDPNPRFSAGKAVGITKSATDKGGVVTWDTPYETSGLIRAQYIPILKAMGEATGTIKK